MPNFETWLAETKLKIAAINTYVVGQQTALDDCLIQLNDSGSRSQNFKDEVKKLSGNNAVYFQSNENLRSGLFTLASIGHDAETLIDLDYFLEYGKIDLNNLLKGEINNDLVIIKQNAIARLVDKSDACASVNKGYIGVIIPVAIRLLGTEKSVDLSVTLYLSHNDVESTRLNASLANSLKSCPEGGLPLAQEVRFLNLAQPNVEASLSNLGYGIGRLDIGNRRTILYGASISNNYVRIFTSFSLRKNRRMQLLTKLDPGYQIQMKLGNEFITDSISAEARKQGLFVHGDIQYTSPSTFNIQIRYVFSGSVKIGCVSIGYEILLGAKVNVILSVSGRGAIVMRMEKLTDPEVISFTGDGIPVIGDLVKKAMNSYVKRFSAVINFTQEYYVNQNQQALSIELKSQFLILKLKM